MRKFNTLLAIVLATLATHAGLPSSPGIALNPVPDTPSGIHVQGTAPGSDRMCHVPDWNPALKKNASKADAGWTEWTKFGTAKFPESTIELMRTRIQNAGDIFPDWDGSFTIMLRENSTDPNLQQLRMDNVFNNVSLTFDYDVSTKALTSPEEQTTGIAIKYPGDGWHNEYHLSVSQASFYPETGNISMSIWITVMPGFGWQIGSTEITADGFQPLEFTVSLNGAQATETSTFFLSSDNTKATLSVNRSSQIKSYRVAVFPYTKPVYSYIVNDLQAAHPTTDYPYTDYTGDSFEIDLTQYYSQRYYIVLLPLGEDGSALDRFTMLTLYSNLQSPSEWTYLGTATLTDIVGHMALYGDDYRGLFDENNMFKGTPQTRTVEVDVRKDNPSIFRIRNPFGPEFPLYDKISPTFPQDNFYTFIDATDPSRVEITYSLSGVNKGGWQPAMIFSATYNKMHYGDGMTREQLDAEAANQYGKYADKRISFPLQSVYLAHDNAYAVAPYKNDLELLLPGYVDYTIDWENSGMPDNNRYTITASPNITSVDCALATLDQWRENVYFPERLCRMVTDKADGLVIKNYPVIESKVIVPAEDLIGENYGYGTYNLIAVPRDAAGNAHAGIVSTFQIAHRHPDDNWILHDQPGTFEENFFYKPYDIDGLDRQLNQVEVSIQENVTTKGLFKLIAPYEKIMDKYGFSNFYTPTNIYIDASDPAHVTFVTDYTRSIPESKFGVSTGIQLVPDYGPLYINTLANYAVATGAADKIQDFHYGTLSNGIIDMPVSAICYGLPFYQETGFGPYQGKELIFRITLPESAGIEAISAENGTASEASAEYFNLQGIRVANPSGGIFIERRGGKVTKRYIP